MAKLAKLKASKGMFFDAIAIAAIKTAEERLTARFWGNGTFISGIGKGAIAFIIPTLAGSNKWTNLISTAFMIDSAEDLVNAGLNHVGFGGGSGGGGMVI